MAHSWAGSILNEWMSLAPKSLDAGIFVDSACLNDVPLLNEYTHWSENILRAPDSVVFIQNWFSALLAIDDPLAMRDAVMQEVQKFDPAWVAGLMKHYPAPKAVEFERVVVLEGSEHFPMQNPRSWRRLFPGARIWNYPATGHFYFMSRPEPFNLALRMQIEQI